MRNLVALLLSLTCLSAFCADSSVMVGEIFSATDTIDIGHEPSADARACLEGLVWDRESFQVRCNAAKPNFGDALIRLFRACRFNGRGS